MHDKKTVFFSRFMACFLIVCMFWVFIPEAAYASQTSGTVSEETKWKYEKLADGTVCITGYSGTEESVILPEKLGNEYVSSIGADVFTGASLRKISIPVTVTEIDSCAFSDKSILICGWNASAAQKYAAEQGMSFQNMSTYIFYDDILDLSSLTGKDWSITEETVFIPYPYAALVKEEVRVYLPDNALFPGGLGAVFHQVTETESGVTAGYTPMNFLETVSYYAQEDVTFYADWSQAVCSGAISMADDGEDILPYSETWEMGPLTPVYLRGFKNFNIFVQIAEKVRISGTMAFTDEITASFVIDEGVLDIMEVTNDISVFGSIDAQLIGGFKFEDHQLGELVVPLVSTVGAKIELSVSPYVDVDGTISFEYEFGRADTITWVNGGVPYLSQGGKPHDNGMRPYSGEIECSAGFGAELSMTVSIGFVNPLPIKASVMEIPIAQVSVKLGPKAEVRKAMGSKCLDFESGLNVTIEYAVGLVGDVYIFGQKLEMPLNYGFTGELLNVYVPWLHNVYHYEDRTKKWQDHCDGDICVVTYYDYSGGTWMEKRIKRGETLPDVPGPIMDGITFAGWYSDQGTWNENWLPGMKVEDDLELYALKELNAYVGLPKDLSEKDGFTNNEPNPSYPYVSPSADDRGNPNYSMGATVDNPSLWKPIDYSLWDKDYACYGGVEFQYSITGLTGYFQRRGYYGPYSINCYYNRSTDGYTEDGIVSDQYFGMISNFSEVNEIRNLTVKEGTRTVPFLGYKEKLERVSLPSSLEEIGDTRFERCSKLTEINFPNWLQTIGWRAFMESGIIEAMLPDTLTSIGNEAFRECRYLERVHLPNRLEVIPYALFWCCTSLEEINFPDTLTRIEDMAFIYCRSLKKVTIPESVEYLGRYAFRECLDMTTLRYEKWDMEGVVNAEEAFVGCQNLRSIYVHKDSPAEDYFAEHFPNAKIFYIEGGERGDEYLVTFSTGRGSTVAPIVAVAGELVPYPEETPYLNGSVFLGWSDQPTTGLGWDFEHELMPDHELILYAMWEYLPNGYETVTVNGKRTVSSVTSYGPTAATPTDIDGQAVEDIGDHSIPGSVEELTVTPNILHFDSAAFDLAVRLDRIIVEEGNPNYYDEDGVLYSRDGALVCYPANREAETFTVPEGITRIASGAFTKANHLTDIVLPASLTTIESGAIVSCSKLTSITFASEPTVLASDACTGCGVLRIYSEEEGPVLSGWAKDHEYLLNYYPVYYYKDDKIVYACFVHVGDLIPEIELETINDSAVVTWRKLGDYSDGSFDFENERMPADVLKLSCCLNTEAYTYESVSGGVKLVGYNGQGGRAHLPDTMFDTNPVVEIAEGIFPEGTTLVIDSLDGIAHEYAEEYGFPYELAGYRCTIVAGGKILSTEICHAGDEIILPDLWSGYSVPYWHVSDRSEWINGSFRMPAENVKIVCDWNSAGNPFAGYDIYRYEVQDEGVVILACYTQNAKIEVPDVIAGYPVTEIRDGAFPESVTLCSWTSHGLVQKYAKAHGLPFIWLAARNGGIEGEWQWNNDLKAPAVLKEWTWLGNMYDVYYGDEKLFSNGDYTVTASVDDPSMEVVAAADESWLDGVNFMLHGAQKACEVELTVIVHKNDLSGIDEENYQDLVYKKKIKIEPGPSWTYESGLFDATAYGEDVWIGNLYNLAFADQPVSDLQEGSVSVQTDDPRVTVRNTFWDNGGGCDFFLHAPSQISRVRLTIRIHSDKLAYQKDYEDLVIDQTIVLVQPEDAVAPGVGGFDLSTLEVPIYETVRFTRPAILSPGYPNNTEWEWWINAETSDEAIASVWVDGDDVCVWGNSEGIITITLYAQNANCPDMRIPVGKRTAIIGDPVITIEQSDNTIMAKMKSGEHQAQGFVIAETRNEVTLETPGRISVYVAAPKEGRTFALDLGDKAGISVRGFVIQADGNIEYSNQILIEYQNDHWGSGHNDRTVG